LEIKNLKRLISFVPTGWIVHVWCITCVVAIAKELRYWNIRPATRRNFPGWGLWMWRKKTNRRPCCPRMSNPSAPKWTARPDGSVRWDNRMAAQQLMPRDLVRPSSGRQQLFQKKKYVR